MDATSCDKITGYKTHNNLYIKDKQSPCGSKNDCMHCKKCMKLITVSMVINEINKIIKLSKIDQKN